ncbi:MAG: transposase [Bacteroidaceae bacterium]|nr:transposase [Bacteroidaceae bacterium]
MVKLKHNEYASLEKKLQKAQKEKTSDDNLIADLEEKLAAAKREMTDQARAICKYATEMSTETFAYKLATEIETNVFGQILSYLKKAVQSNFSNDAQAVRRGERSIRNYKKGMPIPFPLKDRIKIKDNDFYLHWYNNIRFKLHFGKDRSNNRQIVNRCFNSVNDYKLGSSASIQIVKRNGSPKFFLLLVINIPKEEVELNKKIVVGVDLGINVPAYVATNMTEERKAIGDREHFLNNRMAFQRRFKSLQRLRGTAGGKGRTKKLEPLENLRKTERNWVHTQNHLFSREVVKFAVQTHAATIHMEDLSNFGKDKDGNADEHKEFVLRNWSYYELQEMIRYKAKKYGIEVRNVRPAYTSQTCSWCGEQGFRQGATFICKNPECKQYSEKIHADYNAARNIAKSKDIIKKNE